MARLYLVDGSNLFYRALHSRGEDLTAPNGEPTKATYVFTRQLLKLLKERKPEYAAVFFDGDRNQLKKRSLFAGYKAGRETPASETLLQLKRVRQVCRGLGLFVKRCSGYEADDAIAALTVGWVTEKRGGVTVVSRDKDLMTLTALPGVRLFDTYTGEWFDRDKVNEKFGVFPEQMTDYLTLVGDPVDGIPGVKGWGAKNASHWLQKCADLSGILEMAGGGEIPPGLATKLVAAHSDGSLELGKKLVGLDYTVPCRAAMDDLACPELSLKPLRGLFRELGFRSLEV